MRVFVAICLVFGISGCANTDGIIYDPAPKVKYENKPKTWSI